MNHVTRTLILAFVMSLTTGLLVACEDPQQDSSEAEVEIQSGNASLKSMQQLKAKLAELGIWIRYSEYSKIMISTFSENNLALAEASLREYLQHGKRVLTIARRSDISMADRSEFEADLKVVETYLELISQQRKILAGTSDTKGTISATGSTRIIPAAAPE